MSLGRRSLHPKRLGDFPAHLVLNCKHPRDAAIEPIGPQIVAGGYVNELRIEADLIAGPPYAAVNNKAHT